MKKSKKQLMAKALICAMLLTNPFYSFSEELMVITKVSASTISGEEASETDFSFDETTGTISSYSGSGTGNLIVPSTIDGVQVEIIATQAFKNCNFTSVILPDGLIEIKAAAFYSCPNLKYVYIPASVEKIAIKTYGFFPFPNTVTLCVESGSYAETWAQENEFKYEIGLPDLGNVISFDEQSKTIKFGEITSITVNAQDGAEIEWSMSLRQLTGVDTTEYMTWADEGGCGTTRNIIGLAVMPLTAFNQSSIVGTITARLKGTDTSASMNIIVDGSGSVTGADIQNDGVSVAGTTCRVVKGQTLSLQGISIPKGTNEAVAYSSSNTTVATIGSDGMVNALRTGITTITVETTSGMKATCTIEVSQMYDNILEYIALEDGITLLRCSVEANGELIIPEKINGVEVVKIESFCFAGCTGLTSITIPSSITSVASTAFSVARDKLEMLPITIIGSKDSYIESYASENGISFMEKKEELPNGTSKPEETEAPTIVPTIVPTNAPTSEPSSIPTSEPTSVPSSAPISEPMSQPTVEPISEPTSQPTVEPSSMPTGGPTVEPTIVPSIDPTTEPTAKPNVTPSSEPTTGPVVTNTPEVTNAPSATLQPTDTPAVTSRPTITSTPNTTISVPKKITLYAGGTKNKTKKIQVKEGEKSLTLTSIRSTDSKVVSVNSKTAVVTAKKKGTAKIIVTYIVNGKTVTNTIAVTVKKPYISIKNAKSKMKVKKKYTFKATAYGSNKKITWKVSDKSIASIHKTTGRLTVKKKGTIKVTAVSGKFSKTITVKIK